MRYIVEIEGCDDSNYVELELTEEQAQGVGLLVRGSAARSIAACQPKVHLTTYDEATEYAKETVAMDLDLS